MINRLLEDKTSAEIMRNTEHCLLYGNLLWSSRATEKLDWMILVFLAFVQMPQKKLGFEALYPSMMNSWTYFISRSHDADQSPALLRTNFKISWPFLLKYWEMKYKETFEIHNAHSGAVHGFFRLGRDGCLLLFFFFPFAFFCSLVGARSSAARHYAEAVVIKATKECNDGKEKITRKNRRAN